MVGGAVQGVWGEAPLVSLVSNATGLQTGAVHTKTCLTGGRCHAFDTLNVRR